MSNHLPFCKNCKIIVNQHDYDDRYDAYFCRECGKWVESKCDDSDCEYCKNRPEIPPYLAN